MLRVLALSAVLAGPTVDVPQLFAEQLPAVKAKTSVAVLLPQTMPDRFAHYSPDRFAREGRWTLALGAVADCNGATACFIARFTGRDGGRARGPVPIDLARGRKGRFQPLSCGASCSPPSIAWRERGATFSIQAKVGRRALVRMANSAIRNGPR
jgi:hypothetical protein